MVYKHNCDDKEVDRCWTCDRGCFSCGCPALSLVVVVENTRATSLTWNMSNIQTQMTMTSSCVAPTAYSSTSRGFSTFRPVETSGWVVFTGNKTENNTTLIIGQFLSLNAPYCYIHDAGFSFVVASVAAAAAASFAWVPATDSGTVCSKDTQF